MPKYIDENGLLYYDSLVKGKISNAVANKVDKRIWQKLYHRMTTLMKKRLSLAELRLELKSTKLSRLKLMVLYKRSKAKRSTLPYQRTTPVLPMARDIKKFAEVQAAINQALSGITGIDFQIVSTAPGNWC